ncbi:MAG: hypothetical protein JO303_16745 [Caulobacteraceae bacterium]|nr:hypothetical protein [Caulobacteraceae bacterium]
MKLILVSLALFTLSTAARADPAPPPVPAEAPAAIQARLEAALQNIETLERPGQDGYAAVWDGNKYVQCGLAAKGALRCEAAGALMQPSLDYVLSPAKVQALGAMGWRLDPGFGNYVQIFPARLPLPQVAGQILQALTEVYGADPSHMEVETDWLASEPCPPRNGPSQNLAGLVNDAPAMAATAVHDCIYLGDRSGPAQPQGVADLIKQYGPRATGEIQRLRINLDRRVYVILDAGIGYVQCEPETSPPSIYCEAQSAESWPALASVLTPERVGLLHAAGFSDPGRAPNYWRSYPLDSATDQAIADQLLQVLHDVYGYAGASPLTFRSEKDHDAQSDAQSSDGQSDADAGADAQPDARR